MCSLLSDAYLCLLAFNLEQTPILANAMSNPLHLRYIMHIHGQYVPLDRFLRGVKLVSIRNFPSPIQRLKKPSLVFLLPRDEERREEINPCQVRKRMRPRFEPGSNSPFLRLIPLWHSADVTDVFDSSS